MLTGCEIAIADARRRVEHNNGMTVCIVPESMRYFFKDCNLLLHTSRAPRPVPDTDCTGTPWRGRGRRRVLRSFSGRLRRAVASCAYLGFSHGLRRLPPGRQMSIHPPRRSPCMMYILRPDNAAGKCPLQHLSAVTEKSMPTGRLESNDGWLMPT